MNSKKILQASNCFSHELKIELERWMPYERKSNLLLFLTSLKNPTLLESKKFVSNKNYKVLSTYYNFIATFRKMSRQNCSPLLFHFVDMIHDQSANDPLLAGGDHK